MDQEHWTPTGATDTVRTVADLMAERDDLTRRLANADEQRNDAVVRMTAMQGELADAEQRTEEAQAATAEYTRLYCETQERAEKVEREPFYRRENMRNELAKKRNRDYFLAHDKGNRIEALEAKRAELKKAVDYMQPFVDRVDALQAKNPELERERDELRKRIDGRMLLTPTEVDEIVTERTKELEAKNAELGTQVRVAQRFAKDAQRDSDPLPIVEARQRERQQLQAQNAELRAALKQTEWSGHRGECPGCNRKAPDGHLRDCIVGRTLKSDGSALPQAEDIRGLTEDNPIPHYTDPVDPSTPGAGCGVCPGCAASDSDPERCTGGLSGKVEARDDG